MHPKYGEPIPLEADTIYAEQHNNVTLKGHKKCLDGLIRGITSIFKGGNIFGKIVSGIKKVCGFIFKGIKGLLHKKKEYSTTECSQIHCCKVQKIPCIKAVQVQTL